MAAIYTYRFSDECCRFLPTCCLFYLVKAGLSQFSSELLFAHQPVTGLPRSVRSCVFFLEPHISAFPNILNLRTQTFVHRLNSPSLNFAAFSSLYHKSFATILLSCFVVV